MEVTGGPPPPVVVMNGPGAEVRTSCGGPSCWPNTCAGSPWRMVSRQTVCLEACLPQL